MKENINQKHGTERENTTVVTTGINSLTDHNSDENRKDNQMMNLVTSVLVAIALFVTMSSASGVQNQEWVLQGIYRVDSSHFVGSYILREMVTRGLLDCAVVCTRDESRRALSYEAVTKRCVVFTTTTDVDPPGTTNVHAWVKTGKLCPCYYNMYLTTKTG